MLKMELKPPKFELEIEKITTLQNTFWLELKNLGLSVLSPKFKFSIRSNEQ